MIVVAFWDSVVIRDPALAFVVPIIGGIFFGDEVLGFGVFGFAEISIDEVNVECVAETFANGCCGWVKVNGFGQGFG